MLFVSDGMSVVFTDGGSVAGMRNIVHYFGLVIVKLHMVDFSYLVGFSRCTMTVLCERKYSDRNGRAKLYLMELFTEPALLEWCWCLAL